MADPVKTITDFRDESLKYMRENYYPKWEDALRDYKCMTKPIMVLDPKTNKLKEDETRTNVAMPTGNVMVRRNVARLTANPPIIKYRCSSPEVADKLTSWANYQFDRSGEMAEHRRLVLQAEIFGWAVSKTSWDTVELFRTFKRGLMKGDEVAINDRQRILSARGMSPDMIDQSREQAISQYGSDYGDQMHPDEIAQQIAQYGPSLSEDTRVRKYEGPVTKTRFVGDIFFEPGILKLDNSDRVIEQYVETDVWLQKMLKRTYKDPETGQDRPVFDQKAVDDMIADDPALNRDNKEDDLRKLFRGVLGQSDPKMEKRLWNNKKFDILESHSMRDGWMWIEWIGADKYKLGEMPYPHDLYGKFYYTELNLLPDVMSNIGDSTIILARYLMKLDNANEGQKTDLINKLLRFKMLVNNANDIPDETLARIEGDYIVGKNVDVGKNLIPAPNVPPAVYEQAANIMRRLAQLDPGITNVESGTASNPGGGKTATTAILQAKANDVLTQDKVANLNNYRNEVETKKLWILQSEISDMQNGGIEVPGRYAISERFDKASVIRIDAEEIQEDIEVESEASSVLAANDEINRQAAIDGYQLAASNPALFNVRHFAEKLAKTIPGTDIAEALLPDNPQPPVPETRANISIAVKWTELPAEVQNSLLQTVGLPPSQELVQREQLDAIGRVSEAANHAANLESPANPPQDEPKLPNTGGVNG